MEEEDDEILQIKPMRMAPRSTMQEKEDDADDEDQSEDKSTSSPSGTGSPSSSSDTGSSSTGMYTPLLLADEAGVRVKQEKAAEKTKKPQHFKVEARALGLPAGPTRMEKFRNDKRLWDSLELLEDFLQSEAHGSHVGRLVHHDKNCLKLAVGVPGVMHVASVLAPEASQVVPDVVDVLHVVCAVGSSCLPVLRGVRVLLCRLSRPRFVLGVPLRGIATVHSVGAGVRSQECLVSD